MPTTLRLTSAAESERSTASPDDYTASLLRAVADGDREAFGLLYNHTSARLFALALRILSDRAIAEDALQEAYLRIWRQAKSRNAARGSAFGWMATVVRHAAIDTLRKRRARPEVSNDGEIFCEAEGCEDPTTGIAISAGLLGLPPEQRRAVVSTCVYGLSHQEAAVALQVPLGTLKSWVRRGLTALREELSGREPVRLRRSADRQRADLQPKASVNYRGDE